MAPPKTYRKSKTKMIGVLVAVASSSGLRTMRTRMRLAIANESVRVQANRLPGSQAELAGGCRLRLFIMRPPRRCDWWRPRPWGPGRRRRGRVGAGQGRPGAHRLRRGPGRWTEGGLLRRRWGERLGRRLRPYR